MSDPTSAPVLGLADELQPAPTAHAPTSPLLVSTRGDQVRVLAATRAATADGRPVRVVVHPGGADRAAALVLAGATDVVDEASLGPSSAGGPAPSEEAGDDAAAGLEEEPTGEEASAEAAPPPSATPEVGNPVARAADVIRATAAPTDDEDVPLVAALAMLDDGVHTPDAPLPGFVLGLDLEMGTRLPRGVTSLLGRRLQVHWQARLGPEDQLVRVDEDRFVALVHGDLEHARATALGWVEDAADYAPGGDQLELCVGLDVPEADGPLRTAARRALDAAARGRAAGTSVQLAPDVVEDDRPLVEDVLHRAQRLLAARRGRSGDAGASTVRLALAAAVRCGLDDADLDRVVVAASLHLLPPVLVRNVHGDAVGRLLDLDVAVDPADERASACLLDALPVPDGPPLGLTA